MPNEQITVVVQGPIAPIGIAYEVMQSIRTVLPGSPVVLSTWKSAGSKPDHDLADAVRLLDADDTVLSPLPRAPLFDPHNGVRSNLVRMLLSTRAGLQRATTPYALKLRTDTPLVSAGFRSALADLFRERDSEFSVLDQKIVVPGMYTRAVFPPSILGEKNPKWPAVLHLSDWAVFGTTADLLTLYSVPDPEPDYYGYMSKVWPSLPDDAPYRHQSNLRFPPEMHIGLHAIGRPLGLDPEHYLAIDDETARRGAEALLSNAVVLSPLDFGITSLKYWNKVHRPWAERDSALTTLTTRDYAEQYDQKFGTATAKAVPHRERLVRVRRAVTPLLDVMPRALRRGLWRLLGGNPPTLDDLWHELASSRRP